LNAQLNFYYELNKCAQSIADMAVPVSYKQYHAVLSDIVCNENTTNYKNFQKEYERKSEAVSDDEIYVCIRCGNELTAKCLIMDQNFHGRTGPSFLIETVFNCDIGSKATRKLHTGMHVVSDVFCRQCRTNIGWFYHEATKHDQQYKISHFVVECALICQRKQYTMHHYHLPNGLPPNVRFDDEHSLQLPSYMSLSHRNFQPNAKQFVESMECDDDDENMQSEEEEDESRIVSAIRDKKSKKNVTFADMEQNEEEQTEEYEQSTDDEDEEIGSEDDTESEEQSEDDDDSGDEEEEELDEIVDVD